MLPKKLRDKIDFSKPPIDHYNFYRRQDNDQEENDEDDENEKFDLEPYREQISRFEQTLTTGNSSGMLWSQNLDQHLTTDLQQFEDISNFTNSDKKPTSTIFSMDRDHLEVIRLELQNNSQDSEDCDDSSQEGNDDNANEKEKKLAEIERDILHKNYGKIKQGEEEKNGTGQDKNDKHNAGKYPSSQPF